MPRTHLDRMIDSVHYILELQLEGDRQKWYVFSEGICPLFYRLETVKHFRIYRQWLENNELVKKDITWTLLAIQQLVRRWRRFRKAVIKNLFNLQRGLVTVQQLRLTYLK